jgi:hypothetical protein
MKYIKYLNIPTVPEELLDSIDSIVNQNKENMIVRDFQHFQYKTINPKLDKWVYSVFKMNCYAKYQVIYNGIPIHKDNPAFPGDRRIAFNYLLETGGTNVVTTVYDEDKITIMQSERIPVKTWHSLVVEKYHGVEGIEDINKPRVALTVTPIL